MNKHFSSRVRPSRKGGFSLPEVLVASLLIGLISVSSFRSMFIGYRSVNTNNIRLTAINLAQEKLEVLRSIKYYRLASRESDHMGYINTVVIKEGDAYNPRQDILLEQPVLLSGEGDSSVTDAIIGTCRVYIYDVDDFWDGTGWSDVNNAPSDYRRLSIEMEWSFGGRWHRYATTSYISGESGHDFETKPKDSELYATIKKSLGELPAGNSIVPSTTHMAPD